MNEAKWLFAPVPTNHGRIWLTRCEHDTNEGVLMFREIRRMCLGKWVTVLCLCVAFPLSDHAFGCDVPEMPANWKVISDFQVPSEQVKIMGRKLGADLSSVRNTVYDVNGKRVQINVIAAADPENVEKLMTNLRSVKSDEALLQKGLLVYEFVGQNDVLSWIAEGRKHLDQ
jgi:hypothetical protein